MSWIRDLVTRSYVQRRMRAIEKSGSRTDAHARAWRHAGSMTRLRSDSVYNTLTGMGGVGDKTSAAVPYTPIPLTEQQLRSLYDHDGVARRIVDMFPEYAVRKYWTVQGLDPGEDKALMIRRRVQQAMVLAQLFGGAAMLLVTKDVVPARYRDRPQDYLLQPLDLDRIEELMAIHVFDTFEATPMHEETDVTSPDYRGPSYWSISAHGFSVTVHASRVVHFRGRPRIPSDQWARSFGTSRQQDASYLQAVWDQIRHLLETAKSAAVLAQEAKKDVVKIKGLSSVRAGDQAEDFAAYLAQRQQASGVMNAEVMDAEDDFQHNVAVPQGFKDLGAMGLEMLSMVTGAPQMVLFGQAPAGLNTDGEASWEGWRQRVSSFQEQHRPGIERIYQVVGAARASRSEIDPDDVRLTFNPLSEPGDLEKAQVRLVNAQADDVEIRNGVLTPEETRTRYEDDEGYRSDLPALQPLSEAEKAARALEEQQFAVDPYGGLPGFGPLGDGGFGGSAPTRGPDTGNHPAPPAK